MRLSTALLKDERISWVLSPTLGIISECFFWVTEEEDKKITAKADYLHTRCFKQQKPSQAALAIKQIIFSFVHSSSCGSLRNAVSFTLGTELLTFISSAWDEHTGCTYEQVLLCWVFLWCARSAPRPQWRALPRNAHRPSNNWQYLGSFTVKWRDLQTL